MRYRLDEPLTKAQCKVLAAALDLYCKYRPIDWDEVAGPEDEAGVLLEWFDELGTHLVPVDD